MKYLYKPGEVWVGASSGSPYYCFNNKLMRRAMFPMEYVKLNMSILSSSIFVET